MRRPFSVTLALAISAVSIPAFAQPQQPIVVELFTSQGCSSCPPANDAVASLASRPDVLALTFGVTYWDDLGWKDTFASPVYTARQWDYAKGLRHSQVWTPQVIVDGHADTVGQSASLIEPLIKAAKARRHGPTIAVQTDKVTIASAAHVNGAQVWLVRYDPRTVQVAIQRGENGGKTLPHRNVVYELIRLGPWSGAAETFTFKPSLDPNLKTAVLVQAGLGGEIVAAAGA